MGYELCQAIKGVLSEIECASVLSKRAAERLTDLRSQFSWVRPDATALILDAAIGRIVWWTFAGSRFNAATSRVLNRDGPTSISDALKVDVQTEQLADAQHRLGAAIRLAGREGYDPDLDASLIKFADLVPGRLLAEMLVARSTPSAEEQSVAEQEVVFRQQ
jgi:hypothetical protein